MSRSRYSLLLSALLALSVSTSLQAQDYLYKIGRPSFTTQFPVEQGFVNLANGNLHLEIPLRSWPQRGGKTLTLKAVYDSHIWRVVPGYPTYWHSDNGGWRIVLDPAGSWPGFSQATNPCPSGGFGSYTTFNNFYLTEADGTSRSFPSIWLQYVSSGQYPCSGPAIKQSDSGFANDGSGYHMYATNYDNSQPVITVFAPDGTEVYPGPKDSNGNYHSGYGTGTVDTLGRTVYTHSVNGSNSNIEYYDTVASDGVTTARYTVTYALYNVSTNFQSPIGAADAEYSGTLRLIQSIQFPNGQTYSLGYDSGTSPGHYGTLTSITLPTGGTVNYGYTDFVNGSYKEHWINSRTSGGGLWTFTPQAIGSCPTSCTYKQTVKDPANNETVYTSNRLYFLTGVQFYNGLASANQVLKNVTLDLDSVNRVTRQTVTLDTGQTTKTEYAYSTYAGNIRQMITQVKEWDYYTGTPPAPLRTTNISYLNTTAYLNKDIANRISTETVCCDTDGGLKAQTNIYYDDPNGAYTYMVSDSGGATNHDSAFSTSYLTRGNATRVSRWLKESNNWLTTQNQYDDLGNLRQTTDPLGHTTTYSYANNFLNMNCLPANSAPQAYLFQTTNALGQIAQNAYYSCTGLLLWNRDQNDFNASRVGPSFNYDVMNRPTNTFYPDGGQTNFNYNDVPPVYSVVSKYIDASNYTNFYDEGDELGRESRTARANGEPSPNIFDLEEICYDLLGRKSFVSYPYQGPGFSAPHFCSGTGDAFAYDALSRPTSVTNSDGSVVTTSYNGNSTTVCDQAGRCRKSATDALGRLITVCEPDPATGTLPTGSACTYETDYKYDVVDNLTCVEQHGGVSGTGCSSPPSSDATSPWRIRRFTYDSLSRLTQSTNPESGTISYIYDNDGNLTSKTAPAPNQTGASTVTTNYQYDALHRLTDRSGGNLPDENYHYDFNQPWGLNVNNPVGRLVLTDSCIGASWCHVGTVHSYDKMGRLESQTQVNQRANSGTTPWLTFNYTYNLDGSLNNIQYPSGRVLSYAYNIAQRPVSAVDSSNGINYATSAHYTSWGALSSVVNGNTNTFTGITTSNSYNSRMQPLTLSASTPSGTLMSFGYNFNLGNGTSGSDNGNVIGITNGLNSGRSQSFAYDYLNRLTSGQSSATSGSSCWGENFSYDMWANLTARAVSKCAAEGAVPAAMSNNRMATYPYDSAGNYLPTGYTYDAENRLTTAAGITFDYDADGRRVEKSNGMLYLYGADGEVLQETDFTGTLTNEYVFFGGKRIARRNDGSYLSSATIQNASLSQANTLDQSCPCGPYNLGPIPGWTSGGTGPTGSWQPNTISYNAPLPGIVVLSNSGTISQTLTTALQPNTTYTLLVDIGSRLDGPYFADYSLTLQAGSTVLATVRTTNGTASAGLFQTKALTYTAPSSPPAGNITIVLQSYGVQVDFKNVRLNLSSPSTVFYYFGDHLGSSRILTTSAGAPCYDADFFPFGGEQNVYLNTCPQNYKFTGKERDIETGLDDFGARYFSSVLGRFTTPDWAAAPTTVPYAKFGDPQSLNLYGYVENAPLNRADPDGHCCSDWADWIDSKVQVARDFYAPSANDSPTAAAAKTFFSGVAGDVTSGAADTLRIGNGYVAAIDSANQGDYLGAASNLSQDGGRVGATILVVVAVSAKVSPAVNAQEVAAKAGTNSVETTAGRVDLQGSAHYSKAAGKDINTPHVHENASNTNPATGQVHNYQNAVPRAATNADVNAAAKVANVKITPKPVVVKPRTSGNGD